MRALHLEIKSLLDLGSEVQYKVSSDLTGEYEIFIFKDPCNGIPPFDQNDKMRYLFGNSRGLVSTTFYVPIKGGIGDTILVVELLLELQTLLKNKNLDCEFILEMPRARALLFKSFLQALNLEISIFNSEDLGPNTEFSFSYPLTVLEASPNPHRADQFNSTDIRNFLWRKWGFGNYERPEIAQDILTDLRIMIEQVQLGAVTDTPFILLGPAGSQEKMQLYKSWSPARWIDLINRALNEFTGNIVILDDEDLLNHFQSNPRVLYLRLSDYPVNGLSVLGQLILKSETCVFIDSGPAHLAGFLQKNAIVLWGPTSPLIYGHQNNTNLRLSTCPPCSASSRINFCIDQICMSEITSDLIWKCISRRLNEAK